MAGPDVIGLGTEPLPRSGLVFPKAAVIATHTEEISLQQSGADDIAFVIDFTKVGAAPSVVFKIQGVVYPNGDFQGVPPGGGVGTGTAVTWDILTSAAIVATGVLVLQVSDSMVAVTNLVANAIVPDRIRVVCTHSNGDVANYSISAVLGP